MKSSYLIKLVVIMFILSGGSFFVQAKDASYITINGVVKDKKTKKKLEYVTIAVPGTTIGTISNENGGFSIKIKDSLNVQSLLLSHLGYLNQEFVINDKEVKDVTIYLTPTVKELKDVTVSSMEPLALVEKAILKVGENNSATTNLLTGFYRETIKKKRNYITISEAIIDIYKTPYTKGISEDKVQVHKGRSLLSPNRGDTLIVKFLGGPNLSTFLDVVKNPELILDISTLHYYKFTMEDQVMINNKLHYVVAFTPQVILPYALHFGKLYIDKQTLTFSRVEFALNMDNKNKATQAILRKKPFRLHFKPEEVSFVVSYKQQGDRSYLNYIRSEIRFKCDYKRRLFSTSYSVVSEMVVTDIQDHDVVRISGKKAFKEKDALIDKVTDFYDPDFWEDYNIIEPTESLENAVNKLKNQYK